MSTAAVSVLVRIRRHPKAATETCCTEVRDQSEVVLNDRTFKFDRAFDESMTQAHVFDEVGRPTLDAVLQGYNGTILAYGQTGSGKTYTMAGGEGAAEGLMPRMLAEVFGELARRQREADGSFYRCTCSYLQIHNEQITDLLSPSSSTSSSLRIRETADRSTYVEGLRELRLRSATDALNALSAGGKRRSVASTTMNEVSSRSHAVFIFRLQHVTQAASGQQQVRTSSLNLVDLAGSERQQEEELPSEATIELSAPCAATSGTPAVPGARALLQEACHINRSLSALSGVIYALNAGRPHVPYRDSKLTALLRDSLGGNARTWLIATLNPALSCRSESLSTLLFAQRAQQVRNRATVQPERPVPEGEEIGVSGVSDFAPPPAPFALTEPAFAVPAGAERLREQAEAATQLKALQTALSEAESEAKRVTERSTKLMIDTSHQMDELQAALMKEARRASEEKEEQTRAMVARTSAAEKMVRDAMELVEAAESARDCAEEEAAKRVAALHAEMMQKVDAAQGEMQEALADAKAQAEAQAQAAVETALADAAKNRAEAIAEAVRIERVRGQKILTQKLKAARANFDQQMQDALQAAASERAEAEEAAARRAASQHSDAVQAAVRDALAAAQWGADAATRAATSAAVAAAVAEAERKAAASLDAERLEWVKTATAKEAMAVKAAIAAAGQSAARATAENEESFATALAEAKASAYKEAEEHFASALSREVDLARAMERQAAASEAASEKEEMARSAETRLSSLEEAHRDTVAMMESEHAMELKALRVQHEAAMQHAQELADEELRALEARIRAEARAAAQADQQINREQAAALEAAQQEAQEEEQKRLAAEATIKKLELARHMLDKERKELEEELCLHLGAEEDLNQAEQSLAVAKTAAERRESEHVAAVSKLQTELRDQQARVDVLVQQSVQLSAEKAQHALAMRAAAEEHERAMSVMRDEADSLRRCILERDDEVAALREEAEKVAKAHREQVHALNTKLGDMEVQLMFMFNTDGDVSVRSPKFSISGPSIAQASPTRLPQSPARAALTPLSSNLTTIPSSKTVMKAAVQASPNSAAERGPVEAIVARALVANKRRGDTVVGATPGAARRTAPERGPCSSTVEALVARALEAQGQGHPEVPK